MVTALTVVPIPGKPNILEFGYLWPHFVTKNIILATWPLAIIENFGNISLCFDVDILGFQKCFDVGLGVFLKFGYFLLKLSGNIAKSEIIFCYFMLEFVIIFFIFFHLIFIRNPNKYSYHLNTGILWYSNGSLVSGCFMGVFEWWFENCLWSKLSGISMVCQVTWTSPFEYQTPIGSSIQMVIVFPSQPDVTH